MEACATLESMPSVYSIAATGEHYACMVDLLSCVGHLYKADDMIKRCIHKSYINDENRPIKISFLGNFICKLMVVSCTKR